MYYFSLVTKKGQLACSSYALCKQRYTAGGLRRGERSNTR